MLPRKLFRYVLVGVFVTYAVVTLRNTGSYLQTIWYLLFIGTLMGIGFGAGVEAAREYLKRKM